ncbi:Mitochondrial inner membrane protein COX18 [Tolypocladium ophioglossoides CBS 100239]|uniref:Mitochondrial inner membrane protein COX18 n=1 Tax=Tolypocladium ophioglossoides (strain CBS 100239) TaxID=1163406 RepID=A0A0L0NLI3_TOLOC|nr:Mitochondrial inner membrane protein COX18 [Tolypocladium ophioglossoides CBS 100239]
MQSLATTAKGFAPIARVTPTRASAANQRQGRRQFHLGTLGDAVVWTADGISSMHAAGLPWCLSIPLAAVGVNFSFRLPLQLYTRRLVARRNELHPLVAAWGSRHAAAVPRGCDDAAERTWRLRVAGLTEKSRRRIYKAWGVQRWKTLAPFLSMVPFVVVSEALRRLCGAPMGWISHQLGLANVEPISSALGGSSGLVDQSLAQGGCLWFTDLTAMDPYYVLPLLCSALLARTSWGRLSKDQLRALLTLDGSRKTPKTPMSRVQTAIGRTLLLVPLFPLVFADLPSAIFLYWATTFGLNDVNESILERLVPKRTPKLKAVQKAPTALSYLRGTDSNAPAK